MQINKPSKLSLAQLPTPLQSLDRLSDKLGGPRIWLKRDDLTGSATSGNKIRKLEFTFAHALNSGCDAVITCGGIQSNHCRTTALLAAQLGLRCILVLRGEKPNTLQGNTVLDALAGAELKFIPAKEYQKNLNQILESEQQKLEQAGLNPWVIPTGASDGIGIWGYINAAEELKQDFDRLNIQPSHILHATGSGGTQAGLTLGAYLHKMQSQVVGINVCDDEAYFQTKVREDISDWQQRSDYPLNMEELDIQVIDGYVGAGYGKADQAVFQTISELAKLEGVILDPVYSGKAFNGLITEIKQGRFGHVSGKSSSDIVFVHTGGIFGLYAYQQQLHSILDI